MTLGTGIAIAGVSAAVAVVGWRDPMIVGYLAFLAAMVAPLIVFICKD